jgi:hypothetical protein
MKKEIKIDLNDSEIIDYISENHSNNVDLLFEIVGQSTTSWGPYRSLVTKMIEELKKHGELDDNLLTIINNE